jgi:hypothetical protein
MMIYQDGARMAFAVGDLYGQEFAVGKDFKPEDYHPVMHYGINYLLAVGDDMTELHFDCAQLTGISDLQLLSILADRVSRQAALDIYPNADLLRVEGYLRAIIEEFEGN